MFCPSLPILWFGHFISSAGRDHSQCSSWVTQSANGNTSTPRSCHRRLPRYNRWALAWGESSRKRSNPRRSSGRADGLEHPRVEIKKLRVRDQPALGAFGEHRQAHRNQQVFQNAEVILDDLGRNRALAGDRRHVQHAALRKAGRFEEAAERADVAGETLL